MMSAAFVCLSCSDIGFNRFYCVWLLRITLDQKGPTKGAHFHTMIDTIDDRETYEKNVLYGRLTSGERLRFSVLNRK